MKIRLFVLGPLLFWGQCFFSASLKAQRTVKAQRAVEEPRTVDQLELSSYLGEWFEQFRIANRFQDDVKQGFGPCRATRAEYSMESETKIGVKNTCLRQRSDGKQKEDVAKALARVVSNSNNAKLKVNFTGIALLRWLGIGDGDYWVLGLGPKQSDNLYSWALVGSPKRNFAWILSRKPRLDKLTIEEIYIKAESLGYRRDQFVDAR